MWSYPRFIPSAGGGGGGGGSGYPSLILTSPTFIAGKNGQALSAGTASGSFSSTDTDKGDFQIELWLKAAANFAGSLTGNNKFLTLNTPNSGDNNIGLYFNSTNGLYWGWGPRPDFDQLAVTGSTIYADGSWHHFMAVCHNQYSNTYYNVFWDGAPTSTTVSEGQQFSAGTPVPIFIDFSKSSGAAIDSIKVSSYPGSGSGKNAYSDSGSAFTPQSLFVRDTYATVIWQLDGSGVGS